MKRPSGMPVVAWNDVERAISALVAEHRAELAAAQRTIEQLGKDAAALATELDRAVELLSEHMKYAARVAPGLRERTRTFLLAPPSAESTPVQRESSCRDPTECADGQCARTLYGAPPDDIRERLERLEEWASMREHGPLRLAAMEAKGEPGTTFCDEHGREDCGRPDHTKGAKP